MTRRRALIGSFLAVVVALDIVLWLHLFDSGSDGQAAATNGSNSRVETTKPGAPRASAPGQEPMITLHLGARSASPLQTVKVAGRYQGAVAGTKLVVQRQLRGLWVRFPLPTVVHATGRYLTYVELGHVGRTQLRVIDPASGRLSNVVTLTVR